MITYLNRVAVHDVTNSITRFSKPDMEYYGFTNEDDFIAWYMNLRFQGVSFTLISESDIPLDANGKWDRSERYAWSVKDGKIIIDPVKKAKKQAEENQRQAVFNKLGISKDEFGLIK